VSARGEFCEKGAAVNQQKFIERCARRLAELKSSPERKAVSECEKKQEALRATVLEKKGIVPLDFPVSVAEWVGALIFIILFIGAAAVAGLQAAPLAELRERAGIPLFGAANLAVLVCMGVAVTFVGCVALMTLIDAISEEKNRRYQKRVNRRELDKAWKAILLSTSLVWNGPAQLIDDLDAAEQWRALEAEHARLSEARDLRVEMNTGKWLSFFRMAGRHRSALDAELFPDGSRPARAEPIHDRVQESSTKPRRL